jgi:hypothetical protein
MSKTSRSKRTAATPVPRPEQLTAVRRLAESGKQDEARQRLAALKLAHPDFKPLLGLACEIEWLTDQPPIVVAARAWAWHQASPNSRPALDSLRDSARRAGLFALHAHAVQGLHSLALGRPVPLELAPINGPAGLMTPEQAEANDLARMHLADNNPAAAVVVLRGMDHPSARNNLAMALFGCGEVAAACTEAEAAWQADPANLFALERHLRWRCWQQGLAACAGFAATLQASVPRRPEDANARIAALRFLGNTEGAKAAWSDVKDQDYWQLAAPEQIDLFNAQREAGLQAVEVPGERMLWLPLTWVNALSRVSGASRTNTEDVAQAQWDACLDTCDAHSDYLQRAGEQGDKVVRLMAQAVLKRRAKRGGPAGAAALAVLTTWLASLGGPQADRVQLGAWLKKEQLIDQTELAQASRFSAAP